MSERDPVNKEGLTVRNVQNAIDYVQLTALAALLAVLAGMYGGDIIKGCEALTREIRADVMSLFQGEAPIASTDTGNTGSDVAGGSYDVLEEASDVGPDTDSAMTPDVIEVVHPEPVEVLDTMPDEAGQ